MNSSPGSPSAPKMSLPLPHPVRVLSLGHGVNGWNGTPGGRSCWMNSGSRETQVLHARQSSAPPSVVGAGTQLRVSLPRKASKSFETAGKRSISKGSLWKFWVLSWFHARSNCAAWPLAKLSSFRPRDLGFHVPSWGSHGNFSRESSDDMFFFGWGRHW